VEMAIPVEGRRRFRGLLTGTEGDCARIRRKDVAPDESGDVLLRLEEMAEARLALTDALIAESLKRGKALERAARQQGRGRHWRARDPNHAPHSEPMAPGTGSSVSKKQGE
jgi:ribosome maturation factor RimP